MAPHGWVGSDSDSKRTREGSDDEHESAMVGHGQGPVPPPEGHGHQSHIGADASGSSADHTGAGGAPSGVRGPARSHWVSEGALEVGVTPGTHQLLFRDGSGECGWVVRSREEGAVLSRRRREGEERRREKLRAGLDGLMDAA